MDSVLVMLHQRFQPLDTVLYQNLVKIPKRGMVLVLPYIGKNCAEITYILHKTESYAHTTVF